MTGVADSRPRGRQGRSYRFYSGAPLWPFGFSGSYTTWELEWAERLPAELSIATLQGGVGLAVALRNSGRVSSAKALLFFAAVRLAAARGGAPPAFAPPRRSLFAIAKVGSSATDDVSNCLM